MQRPDLIETVREVLQRAGYAVSERCDLRPVSFDIVARRDRDLMMVKVLGNVDAMAEPIAREIKLLCKFLDARPILVGLRSGAGPLEEGVVYNRHDIPIVTPGTLEAFLLQGERPMVFAAPGGFYVHLDATALRRVREESSLSLGVLAQMAGVSRRTIQMYEEGMSASIDVAMRLEESLRAELIQALDPLALFDPRRYEPEPEPKQEEDPMEAMVRRLLEALGYSVRATRRSPFQALTTSDEGKGAILTGIGEDSPALRRRARIVASVSRVTEHPGFFVVERTMRTTLEGTPVVSRSELRDLKDPEAILDLILERAADAERAQKRDR